VFFDGESSRFYLVYRLRRPRGIEPDRGAECRIAVSDDGLQFEDIWTGHKAQLDSASIERSALTRLDDGSWVLYISYVDPADQRWRTDLVRAGSPDAFDLSRRQAVLTAADIDAEGVKDPFVCRVAGQHHMILSYAYARTGADRAAMHTTSDAYNTGQIVSATGLATSEDGLSWQWEGGVMQPSDAGWDRYCARIGCVYREQGLWIGLYDGSADVSQNYEEQVGVAFSHDLRTFHRVTRRGPWMRPGQGEGEVPGALRYFDVIDVPGRRYVYYEMARGSGGHDLRVWRCQRG
jgi:hypothetical protein